MKPFFRLSGIPFVLGQVVFVVGMLGSGDFISITACHAQQSEVREEKPTKNAQATSLFGKPLYPMELTAERKAKLQRDLAAAVVANGASAGIDVEKLVWVGRRYGYLQDYQQAIAQFSKCVEAKPDWPHAYRHRGHRYISIRKFDLAIKDLTKAAELIDGKPDEIEQDGAPNSAGVPTSTLHTNIWYHLGLAHYLAADYQSALVAFEKCLDASKNNDMKVATLDWMYMTLCRLQRNDEAKELLKQVSADMELLENHAYHRRLLMYKGELKPKDLIPEKGSDSYDLDMATYGYGVGNWYLRNGQEKLAKDTFQQVVDGKYWSAFGYIAAEVELSRLAEQANQK